MKTRRGCETCGEVKADSLIGPMSAEDKEAEAGPKEGPPAMAQPLRSRRDYGASMKKEANELVRLANYLSSTWSTLRCISPGRVEISRGASARSAEVKKGDIFNITRQDTYRFYGSLDIRGFGFRHDPGFSGQKVSPGLHKPDGIEFAIIKENIVPKGTEVDEDFWAKFERA